MPITESINVENVGVGGRHQYVLGETVHHVPWVKVHEGSNKVNSECRGQGEDDEPSVGCEEFANEFRYTRGFQITPSSRARECPSNEIERENENVAL